ncbi:MAG: 50S ribosomal protein L18 [Pantoea sp. Brub]|nr:50S ribosomal protein L18 [Pantoea sp. Brub]
MDKKFSRIQRAKRTRCKIKKSNLSRLIVHRTSRHIYAQITSSNGAKVFIAASTLEKAINKDIKYTGNKEAAIIIGNIIAKRAIDKGITEVSFDRSGFQYHGRIKALAEAARETGLQF